MTLEAMHSLTPEQNNDTRSDEELIQSRIDLHHELGRWSVLGSTVYQGTNDCVARLTETNQLIAKRGIDTSQLTRDLQSSETMNEELFGYVHQFVLEGDEAPRELPVDETDLYSI